MSEELQRIGCAGVFHVSSMSLRVKTDNGLLTSLEARVTHRPRLQFTSRGGATGAQQWGSQSGHKEEGGEGERLGNADHIQNARWRARGIG